MMTIAMLRTLALSDPAPLPLVEEVKVDDPGVEDYGGARVLPSH